MKLYLSGPMTGYEDHNLHAFQAGAKHLRSKGHEVVSPAELDAGDGVDVTGNGWTVPDHVYEGFMERDLSALEGCEGIVFLPGWRQSGGVGREGRRAVELGLRLYLLEGDPYERPDNAYAPLLRIDTQFFLEHSTTERAKQHAG